ncbi:MAG: hypothetical protein AAGF71_09655 [Pseudomonadota bacterium]
MAEPVDIRPQTAGGRVLSLLDDAFRHPAITAVLGGALAIAATVWLDAQAAKRDARTAVQAQVDALFTDATRFELLAGQILGTMGPRFAQSDPVQMNAQRQRLHGAAADYMSAAQTRASAIDQWLADQPDRNAALASVLLPKTSGQLKPIPGTEGPASQLVATHMASPVVAMYQCALASIDRKFSGYGAIPLSPSGPLAPAGTLPGCTDPRSGEPLTLDRLVFWVRACLSVSRSALYWALAPRMGNPMFTMSVCEGPTA